MRDSKEYILLDTITPKAVASSTDATPIVVTASLHGFSNGDLVTIYGHTTNIAANGIYKVANKATNTFELTDRYTGANIAGSGAGAGSSGLAITTPKIVFAQDFMHGIINIITSGTATLTVKIAGSLGKTLNDTDSHGDTPNFGATVSVDNPYGFVQAINLDDGTVVDGSTGIVVAGTDINKTYEINTNAHKYITIIPTSWTAGAITIKLKLFNNQ